MIAIGSPIIIIFLCTASITLILIGWGNLNSFFLHPARAGPIIILIVFQFIVLLFGKTHLKRGLKEVGIQRLMVPISNLIIGIMLWILPYADNKNILVIEDGDSMQYLGLFLCLLGAISRTWAILILKKFHSPFVIIQEAHKIITQGIYRWIRHPSYLGMILWTLGFGLIFRNLIGALIFFFIISLGILWRIRDEEDFLVSEFGDEYLRYKEKSWRLLPFIY